MYCFAPTIEYLDFGIGGAAASEGLEIVIDAVLNGRCDNVGVLALRTKDKKFQQYDTITAY